MTDQIVQPFVAAPTPGQPRPQARPWYHLIVEFNPFYLLSAVAMLFGVGTLSNQSTWNPVPLSQLMPLLGALQVYEIAMLAAGVWLYKRVGPRRDALQIVGLVMLFAVDVSFLMSEIATSNLAVGAATSAGLLGLALLKGGVILAIVRPILSAATVATGLVGLVVLHATPVLLTGLDDEHGGVTPLTFYALWWIVGLSPLLHDAYAWFWRDAKPRGELHSKWWPRVIAGLPWVSLAIHLGVLHYVYDRPFMAPHATPLLIGLALLLRPYGPGLMPLRIALTIVAALISLPDQPRLDVTLGPIEIGPDLLGLAAAWMALAYANFPRLVPMFAATTVAAGGWRLFGPTWDQLAAVFRSLWSLVPRTRQSLGLTAVIGAFLLLLAGIATSLLHRPKAT